MHNVMTVATGTAASQAIAMAFAPVLTRLYGPEAYGLQGVFMSVLGLLSTVAALGYPTAVVLPRTDAEATAIARLSIYLGLLTAAFVAILLAFSGPPLLTLLNAEALTDFMFLLPAAMFISVLSGVLAQWLIRKQAFKLSASYGAATTLVVSAIKACLGYLSPSAVALVATNTFGGLIGTIFTFLGWKSSLRPEKPNETTHPARKTLSQLAGEHIDFPLFRTPQNLINAISHSLPILLLATYFGAESAGQYTIAIAVLGMPANVVGNSVTAVFYPRITEAIRNGEDARALIVRGTLGMAAAGALPFLAVLLAGPVLFQFVFGTDWHIAGIYAQILSFWLFLQYVNKPAVSAIPALRLQRGLLIYEVFSTATKVLGLWIGLKYFESDIASLTIFSLFGSLAYAWLILWVIKRSNGKSLT